MSKQYLYISEPMDFVYKEGNAVDLEKTFDLTGNDNDQMLKLYLKKAGLSDSIEYLTPEQRKALIYDIVKSNKNPGYWKPSTLPTISPNATIRTKNPPTQQSLSENVPSIASIDDIPPAAMTFDSNHYSQVNISNSKLNGRYMSVSSKQLQVRKSLYEIPLHQQQQNSVKIYNTPPTPPSPSTLVTRKGLKIEISGPTNFEHISGDMTRDMTKNSFDLSGHFNDNLLKKYMIERSITEEDVRGMDNKELIRKIVQSKFTWMPIRKQYVGSYVPPPPSETYVAPSPPPPPRNIPHSKGGALIVPPPILPTNEKSEEEDIYIEIPPQGPCTTPINRRPAKPPPPVPPPVLSSGNHVAPSPPRSPPRSPPQPPLHSTLPPQSENYESTSFPATISKVAQQILPPPPPPMPGLIATQSPSSSQKSSKLRDKSPTLPTSNTTARQEPSVISEGKDITSVPPPPPPPSLIPPTNKTTGGPPPPPPLPPIASGMPIATVSPKSREPKKPAESGDDTRDALLESIRAGITLKKVNKNNQPKPGLGTIRAEPGTITQPQPSTPPAAVRQEPAKSEPIDFMSELRNATLKRIKKLEHNTYASETSESNC